MDGETSWKQKLKEASKRTSRQIVLREPDIRIL
jgi:hypothetical protein